MEDLGYKVYDKHVAFWGSPLSNFYPCEFSGCLDGIKVFFEEAINKDLMDLNNFKWKSSEQCFMAQKAATFMDVKSLLEIMFKTERPEEAKKLGRKVKDFNDNVWSMVRKIHMKNVVYAKFSQNQDLKEFLLSPEVEDKDFVEGSPFDGVWGVKMDYRNPDIDIPENWNGDNLFGKVLNEVRKKLKEDEKKDIN